MSIVQAGSTRFLDNDGTLNVNWTLTRKCNYHCSYCTVYDNENGFFPAFEKLQLAVDKIAALKANKINITLSGGEPTFHPDYADFLKLILQNVGNLERLLTITNLSRTPRYFKKMCEQVEPWKHKLWFKASFHFEHADVDTFVENAKILAASGIRTELAIMAHPERMDQVRELHTRLSAISEEFEQLFCDVIVIRQKPEGTPDARYRDADLVWLGQNGADEARMIRLDELVDAGTTRRVVQSLHTASELVASGKNRFKGMQCYAGVNMLVIRADGTVSAALCFKKEKQKTNIYATDQVLALAVEPIVCPFEACGCLADIAIPKSNPMLKTQLAVAARQA